MSMAAASLEWTAAGDNRDSGIASRRFFDRASDAWMVKVLPGEYFVTAQPDEILVTVLGSCVSACILDIRTVSAA
jgi:Chemotaxis protein; stimulates methylation of MCP proteins